MYDACILEIFSAKYVVNTILHAASNLNFELIYL